MAHEAVRLVQARVPGRSLDEAFRVVARGAICEALERVGHERDVTVSDLVADLRAPTPSAAAEIVIPRKEDLREKIDGLAAGLSQAWESVAERGREEVEDFVHRLSMAVSHAFEINRNLLEQTRKKLSILNPAVAIPQYKAKIVDLARQIQVRMEHILSLKASRFSGVAEPQPAQHTRERLQRHFRRRRAHRERRGHAFKRRYYQDQGF